MGPGILRGRLVIVFALSLWSWSVDKKHLRERLSLLSEAKYILSHIISIVPLCPLSKHFSEQCQGFSRPCTVIGI